MLMGRRLLHFLVLALLAGGCHSSTVTYNGIVYATLDFVDPWSTSVTCQQGYIALPSNWAIAEDNAESRYVIANYPWGTHVVALRNGYCYCTTQYGTAGSLFSTGCLHDSGNYEYAANGCNVRILIQALTQTNIATTTSAQTGTATQACSTFLCSGRSVPKSVGVGTTEEECCVPVQLKPCFSGEFAADFWVEVPFHAQKDFCKDTEMDSLQNQSSACEEFCGPEAVPLLLGTSNTGFDLQNVEQALRELLGLDASRLTHCDDLALSFGELKRHAATFLAAQEDFYLVRLLTAAKIEEAGKILAEKLMSVDIHSPPVAEKGKVFLDSLRDELFKSVGEKQFEDSVANLQRAAQMISQGPADLRTFANTCGKFVIGARRMRSGKFLSLLDLCAVSVDGCIGEAGSQHISCACAVHPVAGINVASKSEAYLVNSIPAEIRRNSTVGHRRLEEMSAARVFHTCAEANELSKQNKTLLRSQLVEFGKGPLLDSRDAWLVQRYHEYFCGERAKLPMLSRRLSPSQQQQPQQQESGEPTGRVLSRQCPSFQYATFSNSSLKAVSSPLMGEGTCSGAGISEDQIMQAAFDFCGPAVPVVIGRSNQGFNMSIVQEVCGGHPQALLKHDQAAVSFCDEQEKKLLLVSESASAFLGELQNLDYSILKLQNTIAEEVGKLRAELFSTTFRIKIENALRSQKMPILLQLYEKVFNDIEKEVNMTVVVEAVERAVEQLVSHVNNYLVTLPEYLRTCNGLFLAATSQKETLLHICRQNSGECLNYNGEGAEEAWQVAACCAFNPVAQAPRIPGLTGERRLGSASPWLEIPHLCAESHNHIDRAEEVARKMYRQGGLSEARLAEYEGLLKVKYHSFFDDDDVAEFCEHFTTTTTSTTTTSSAEPSARTPSTSARTSSATTTSSAESTMLTTIVSKTGANGDPNISIRPGAPPHWFGWMFSVLVLGGVA